jgi:hypothetical protein
MAFVILLYIMISYVSNRHIKDAKKAKFKILGKVPRGKSHDQPISTQPTLTRVKQASSTPVPPS